MKILELGITADSNRLPELILATDSSLVKDNRPVFLPEFSDNWECRISVAYRISRLGKSISKRFASRYYDAMTLTARFCPAQFNRQSLTPTQMASPWMTAFDGSVAIGRWIDLQPTPLITASAPAEDSVSLHLGEIDNAIELLSRFFILKTGDIIVPQQPVMSFKAEIGSRVELSIGNETILAFNIK